MIAEIKRASPSQGDIRPDLTVRELAAEYEAAGASAVSILTEEHYFKGSLADIEAARSACSLPLLRKDFIIDAYQVWEAVEAGADALLLIVAALERNRLEELYNEAHDAGLDCLVEVHNRTELDMALGIEPDIIGINNRDLASFEVDLATTEKLAKFIPDEVIVVGESGIMDSSDAARLAAAGVDAILVGETLMRSASPGKKLQELISF